MKCIIVRCHESKAVFAHAVPCKGADEDGYVVEQVCADIAWLGYTKMVIKSDNEVALLSLIKRVLDAIRCQVLEVDSVSSEQAPTYDSQSNGGTEVGGRIVR